MTVVKPFKSHYRGLLLVLFLLTVVGVAAYVRVAYLLYEIYAALHVIDMVALTLPLLALLGGFLQYWWTAHRLEKELVVNVQKSKQMTAKMLSYINDLGQYQQRLQHEKDLRDRLLKYVSADVVEQIGKKELPEDMFKNERREATVLFADVRGFTTMSESMQTEELILMLNNYFDKMVDVIFAHGGMLDKFMGDELMAVFYDKHSSESVAANAVHAAIGMQEVVKLLSLERARQGKSVLEVGIGINTGHVVVGNVGSRNRMDYTAVGDAVNVAARLQGQAGRGEIVVSDSVYKTCKDIFRMEPKGKLMLRNRREPVQCYDVIRK